MISHRDREHILLKKIKYCIKENFMEVYQMDLALGIEKMVPFSKKYKLYIGIIKIRETRGEWLTLLFK